MEPTQYILEKGSNYLVKMFKSYFFKPAIAPWELSKACQH